MLQRRGGAVQIFQLVLGEIADADVGRDFQLPPEVGCSSPTSSLISVDLPAPFGPSSAMRAPARSTRSTLLNRCLVAVAEAHFLGAQQQIGAALRRFDLQLEMAVGDMRRGDARQPLQRLDAALRLLGLGGLGAEAAHEIFQVGDLCLLLVWKAWFCCAMCSARARSKSS